MAAQKIDLAGVLVILETVLSTLFISGINIIISGHILGYAFGLSTSGKDHFTLYLPPVIRLKVSGKRTFAGFAAFTISLLMVGIFLSEYANQIFIVNLGATESRWTAAQSLAATLSLIFCLLISAVWMSVLTVQEWFSVRHAQKERVAMLIKDESESTPKD